MAKISLEGKTKEVPIKKGSKLVDILKQLRLNPEDYIVVLNGEVVTELETVKDSDKVKLVRVWSGG